MEMESYISLGGTIFHSLSLRKKIYLGKDTFETTNKRAEHGPVNLCVRYEGTKYCIRVNSYTLSA